MGYKKGVVLLLRKTRRGRLSVNIKFWTRDMSMYPLPPDPYSDPKYDKKRGRWNLNRDDIGPKEIAAAFFAVGLFILVGLLILHIKSKNDLERSN